MHLILYRKGSLLSSIFHGNSRSIPAFSPLRLSSVPRGKQNNSLSESFAGEKAWKSKYPRLTLEKANEENHLGIELGYLDSQAALLPAVANGQYDAAFMIKSAAYIGLKELKYNMKAWESKYKKLPIAYVFRKTPDQDQMRETVNKTLDEMHKDGTLKKMSEKWFGEDITPEPEN